SVFWKFHGCALSTSVLFRMHRKRKAHALFVLAQPLSRWLLCGSALPEKFSSSPDCPDLLLNELVEFRLQCRGTGAMARVNAGAAALSASAARQACRRLGRSRENAGRQ